MIAIGPMAERDNTRLESESYGEGEKAIPIVTVQDLSFRWSVRAPYVLGIGELSIQRGERVFIAGPSGSGKTTLLNLLAGVVTPDSGHIVILGTDIASLSGPERDAFRSAHIGLVFQMFNLIPYLSAIENVLLPCRFSHARRAALAEAGTTPQEEAHRLLSHLQLDSEHLLRGSVTRLSAGQQQRVAVARALIGKPELMICDEPTSALDVSVQAQILNLLLDLRRELGLTLVLISHDLAVVEHMANRIAVMYLGRIVEEGTAEQVFDRPRHPYTKALLGSVLTPEPELGLPEVVLGATFPNPVEPPAGCVFHPRCPEFIEGTCDAAQPALLPVDDNVRVRCFRTESGPSS